MILCAKQRWESMGDALRKLLQEACAIWPRGAPIGLVCLVLNYARVLEKHEPVRSFQLGKGVLEWFALAALMTIELPLAR